MAEGQDSETRASPSCADESAYVDSALHTCARLGDVDGLRQALEDKDNNVDSIGLYRWSALHEACANSDEDVIGVLLEAGAKPWLCDALHNRTSLHYAAEAGDKELLASLIKHCSSNDMDIGQLMEILDDEGKSPLDVASGECLSYLEEVVAEERTRHLTSAHRQASHPRPEATTISSHRPISPQCANMQKQSQLLIRSPEQTAGSYNEDPIIALPGQSLFDSHEIREDLPGIALSDHGGNKPIIRVASCDDDLADESSHHRDTTANSTPAPRLQMSFEYNAKTGRLKLRLKQLCNMPRLTGALSTASHLYVKSSIEPDSSQVTKRKTGKVAIPPVPEADKALLQECDVIPPLSFHEPLHYENIGTVNESRAVRLSVCCYYGQWVTSNAELAFTSVPLRKAVQSLMPQWYQLQLRQTMKTLDTDNRNHLKPGRVYGIARSGTIPNTDYTFCIRNKFVSESLSECVDVSTSEEDLDELTNSSSNPFKKSDRMSLASLSTEESFVMGSHVFRGDNLQASSHGTWMANMRHDSHLSESSLQPQEWQSRNHLKKNMLVSNQSDLADTIKRHRETEAKLSQTDSGDASELQRQTETKPSQNVITVTRLVQRNEGKHNARPPPGQVTSERPTRSKPDSNSLQSQHTAPRHLFQVKLNDKNVPGIAVQGRKETNGHAYSLNSTTASRPRHATGFEEQQSFEKEQLHHLKKTAQQSSSLPGCEYVQCSGPTFVSEKAQLKSSTRQLFQAQQHVKNTNNQVFERDQLSPFCSVSGASPCQKKMSSNQELIASENSGRTMLDASRQSFNALCQTGGQMFGKSECVIGQKKEQLTFSESSSFPEPTKSASVVTSRASYNPWIPTASKTYVESHCSHGDDSNHGNMAVDVSQNVQQPMTTGKSAGRFSAFNSHQRQVAGSNPFIVDMEPLMNSQANHKQIPGITYAARHEKEASTFTWQQHALPGSTASFDQEKV